MSYISAVQPASLADLHSSRAATGHVSRGATGHVSRSATGHVSRSAMGHSPRVAAAPAGASPLSELPVSTSARLSTGLELTLMLATLSGLSLTLCMIAAGAF